LSDEPLAEGVVSASAEQPGFIKTNSAFAGYTMGSYTFWKLALTGETKSIQSRTDCLAMDFSQVNYEHKNNRTRKTERKNGNESVRGMRG
jgi:hypothetical protein